MTLASPRNRRFHCIRLLTSTLSALVLLGMGIPLQAAVTAGGIAIVGYTDNLSEDTFSIVALETIASGTTIYFTDNGWNVADGQFRGASASDGNGNETLIKLTFTSSVPPGTLMKSGADGAGYAWDTTSTITGSAPSEYYSYLLLAHSGAGEQIYAFEADNDPPLFNPSNHIFVLDMGDESNGGGFEDATSPNTGNLAPGLSLLGNTAVELPDPFAGDDLFDYHNGSFALYMLAPDVFTLNLFGGTKEQWLAAITDTGNWYQYDGTGIFDPSAENSLSTFNVVAVPEPSRALLLMNGIALLAFRRRRC